MEAKNRTPHGYEWRYHRMPGEPGARWVLCRKMSSARAVRIALQKEQRETSEKKRAKREVAA